MELLDDSDYEPETLKRVFPSVEVFCVVSYRFLFFIFNVFFAKKVSLVTS